MRSKVVPKEGVPILSSDECVTYEKDLPYPYVHYPSRFGGAFFGFQKNQDGPVFHCSCQRKGMEVYLLHEAMRHLKGTPKQLRC